MVDHDCTHQRASSLDDVAYTEQKILEEVYEPANRRCVRALSPLRSLASRTGYDISSAHLPCEDYAQC